MNTSFCLLLMLPVVFGLEKTREAEEFKCPDAWGYYPDNTNCIKYYICENGIPSRITCDKRDDVQLLYDSSAIACDYPVNVDCGPIPICDEHDENCHSQDDEEDEDDEDDEEDDEEVDFDCPELYGYYEDPKNCIKYYRCEAGKATRITCDLVDGVRLQYDPIGIKCEFPINVDCGARPVCDENDENCKSEEGEVDEDYTCPSAWGYFSDPKNCIKFYHCQNNKGFRRTCEKADGQQLHYDEDGVTCDFPVNVDCGSRPICDADDDNCNEVVPNKCAAVDCDDAEDEFVPMGDCETFACRCVHGKPMEFECPQGQVWDPINGICNYPDQVETC